MARLTDFLSIAVLVLFLYHCIKYLYRISPLHPLARFPGPRLAALTNLYGGWFDLSWRRSYVKELAGMHDRYGPIVRAWPNQLHVRDLDAYNQIFRVGTEFFKSPHFYTNPVVTHSFFNITSTRAATARRAMMMPFFSRDAVRRAEKTLLNPIIDKFVDILAVQHANPTGDGSRVVDMTMATRCFAADSVMNFEYQKPLGVLDAPGFQAAFIHAMDGFSATQQWPIYFPKTFGAIFRAIEILPSWMVERFMQPFAHTQWVQRVCYERIAALQDGEAGLENGKGAPTVFDIALNPKMEKGHPRLTREELAADAFLFMVAGTDTTADALTAAVFNTLYNPKIHARLRDELRGTVRHKHDTPGWAELEKLPYLHGIVKESLRLSYGVPGRLPRVVPDAGAIFCGQKIPPGTQVSCSIFVYHHHESAWQDSFTFKPERWIVSEDQNADAVAELEKRFLSFSRGSRSCPGMNLAYANLHLLLARLFRRFDMELFETGKEEMDWKDSFVPMTRGHLRIKIREAED